MQTYSYSIDDVTPFIPFGFVCFWKPEQTFGVFSNWANTPFVHNNEKFATSEHYMMAEKARLMGDENTRQKILANPSPSVAKKLGQSVKPWDEQKWLQHRCRIMYEACRVKFSSSPELLAQLMATGTKVLVEASSLDRIWGIGMTASDPRAQQPTEWKGLNLLGKVLMQVREDLRV
jgi:hypothetical protein